MLSKDHLKTVFNKACLENNSLIKQNIISKWVHRFGFDSLEDLLLSTPVLKEEGLGTENQNLVNFKLSETSEILEEKFKSNEQNTLSNFEITNKKKINQKNKNKYIKGTKLPLPYIDNLRRWIKNDKKAS